MSEVPGAADEPAATPPHPSAAGAETSPEPATRRSWRAMEWTMGIFPVPLFVLLLALIALYYVSSRST